MAYEASNSGSSMWVFVGIGALVAVLIGVVMYFTLGRAETRPVKQGFYGGPITGTSAIPCGRMSSEASACYAMFAERNLDVGEEGKADLMDLKNLLSKLCCFKQDLMAPQHLIAAVKELGFSTHQDIQPLGDLTGRCFSKTVPERDLSIQFQKWRDSGLDLIRRLCTAGNFSEAETQKAEQLFLKAWRDVQDVALTMCMSTDGKDMHKVGRHDAAPHTPEELDDLRPYDGYY
jgi:hypothetical protein